MVTAIEHALRTVFSTINGVILEMAFPAIPGLVVPLGERIRQNIIMNRVLHDCNLEGGKTKDIVLREAYWETTTREAIQYPLNMGRYSLYRIPPDARDYVPLLGCGVVRHPQSTYANVGEYMDVHAAADSVSSIANDVLRSHTHAGAYPVPIAEVLSGDLIQLTPAQYTHIEYVVTCRISYDENLANLNLDAIRVFGLLVAKATEAYIYNNLAIDIDRICKVYGRDVDAIRKIIEKYESSEERYQELLSEDFAGAATYDPKRLAGLIAMQLPL